jgi:hypothetical protein
MDRQQLLARCETRLCSMADFEARYGLGVHWHDDVQTLVEAGFAERYDVPEERDHRYRLTEAGKQAIQDITTLRTVEE